MSLMSDFYFLPLHYTCGLQFKFTVGKPRGCSLASFTFTGSAFSRFFHVKGVKTPSDFVETWEKFVQPSLDSTTGAMSSWAADDSANQTETPPQSTATAHSFTDKTPRSTRCDFIASNITLA